MITQIKATKNYRLFMRIISELVENYLMAVTKLKARPSKLLAMVDELKPSNYPEDFNFEEEYYKVKTRKHGV